MKRIVSVQDISCLGQCSLTIALPILSAYGIETAILPSGILSTHTGCFSDFSFLDLTDELTRIIGHWRREKLFFDAIFTGYIGDARQFAIIKDMRDMMNPGGKLIVDPAMADRGKLYPALDETIVAGMRELVSEADMIFPNLTEAAFLLGREYRDSYTREETEELLKALADLGPDEVVLTGVSYEAGKIGAAAYKKSTGETTEYFVDKLPESYHGTGDIFSSVVTANLLNDRPLSEAIRDACDFISESIKKTLGDDNHMYGVKFEQVLAERQGLLKK